MPILPEPQIIFADTENKEFWFNSQLQDLFSASQNLNLTSRDGVIQNGDKAGNFAAQYVVYTSNGAANTEDAVQHGLGRKPTGYLVVNQDKAGIVYNGTTAVTETTIYLKCSVASVALTIMVF